MSPIVKKNLKITITTILILIVLITALIGIYLASAVIVANSADTSGTALNSTYYMDEESSFVANIPYEKYLNYDDNTVSGTVYDVKSLGVSPTATPKENHSIIQQSINSASENGGGTVLVDGGVIRTLPITLKDNVTLKIAKNSCLENITYEEHLSYGLTMEANAAFIKVDNAENVSIIGPGRIAGNGATYCNSATDSSAFLPLDTFNLKTFILEHRKRILTGKDNRYFMLSINYCTNITIQNLEIYESGFWTCRAEGNDTLTFENVIINNNVNVANSDGIDIVGGKNTTIRQCFIATGDDGICVKTEGNSPAVEGLLVENCEIMSLANCFKIGTGTYSDISNINVKNNFFFLAGIAGGYSGIALESVDGGRVFDINIENITMENITSPLLIWLGKRNGIGELKNIVVKNIVATNCDIASAVSGHDYGKDTLYVKNVLLENFSVSYREANENIKLYFNSAYEGSMNMGGYPEITRISHMYLINHTLSVYCDMPVYGLFARHVDGLTVTNFNVVSRSCNTRELTNIGEKNKEYDIINSYFN